uniref:Putative conserved secreted protein n=1 Tax=Ixodes ricinus TaxID=34613 RepID=A0A6B0UWE8_IXORI
MFTLKFFILFVLAGLCFGDTSASGTGSNTQGNDASDGQEKEKEEVGSAEKSAGGNGVGGKEDSGKAFDDVVGLPSWIKEPKSFMNSLLDKCRQQHYHYERINNETIKWEECKYKCAHYVGDNGHELPLPEGTPCGPGKKCIKSSCVEDPEKKLPSCR